MNQQGNPKKPLRISAGKIKTLEVSDVQGRDASEEIAVAPTDFPDAHRRVS